MIPHVCVSKKLKGCPILRALVRVAATLTYLQFALFVSQASSNSGCNWGTNEWSKKGAHGHRQSCQNARLFKLAWVLHGGEA